MGFRQFRELRLRDFRCFHERQTVPLAPLTLLVGENSTGKTSFLVSEDVAVLHFERDDIEVRIHPIRFDENGNVQDAPPSYRRFFTDELNRSLDDSRDRKDIRPARKRLLGVKDLCRAPEHG